MERIHTRRRHVGTPRAFPGYCLHPAILECLQCCAKATTTITLHAAVQRAAKFSIFYFEIKTKQKQNQNTLIIIIIIILITHIIIIIIMKNICILHTYTLPLSHMEPICQYRLTYFPTTNPNFTCATHPIKYYLSIPHEPITNYPWHILNNIVLQTQLALVVFVFPLETFSLPLEPTFEFCQAQKFALRSLLSKT